VGPNVRLLTRFVIMIDMILYALRQLGTEVPFIIVLIGCIITACILWRRAPASSLYIILACVFTMVLLFMYPFSWAIVLANRYQNIPGINTAFSVGWSVARGIATVLFVIAVYAGRKQA
jgi:hypothetical protein